MQSRVLSLISSAWAMPVRLIADVAGTKKLNCRITHLQHNSLNEVRQYIEANKQRKTETTKIAANIKASVLRLAVVSQWCERISWWQQATTSYTRRPHRACRLMSLVLPVITVLLICSV